MLHNIEKIPFEEILNDNSKGATSEGDVLVREDGEDELLAVVNAVKRKVDNCRGRRRVKCCLEKVPRREYKEGNVNKQKGAIQHSIMP